MTAAVAAKQAIGPGLGASEIAAALGLHPYKSPLQLWQEKVGEAAPFDGNEYTEWGLLVEPALLAWYERTLERGQLSSPTESLYHPEISWARATPDAFVVAGPELPERTIRLHLVQAKHAAFWSGRRWDKGPPDEVQLQCQWELFVTGLQRADVVAALGGQPPATWTVYRDDAIIGDLVAAAKVFWRRVEERTPPPVDHRPEWAEYFGAKIRTAGLVASAPPEVDAIAAELRSNRAALRALERKRDQLVNEIRGYLAGVDADAVETAEGVITWRESAGSPMWKAVAEALARRAGVDQAELDALANALRGKAKRTFNVPRAWDQEH